MKTFFAIIFALGLLTGSTNSLAQNTFVLQPQSRVWIDGSSNVNRFTCEADKVVGEATIVAPTIVRNVSLSSGNRSSAELSIPVRSFDCGQQRMNADMQKALKAGSHPLIQYRLAQAEVISTPAKASDWHRIRTSGYLTIAGVEVPVELIAEGRQVSEGVYRIRAQKKMKMSTFGVTPPTAMLGLVKASNDINVRFDLTAACEQFLAGGSCSKALSANIP